ncbi:hypothetical protein COT64_01850 [Candidatus Shapirobacteria bacterium CG09_land_8_20_14_0_10_39_12]|uniref:LysM domain-containing protein n=1 Tax=Candidatus Shapirobacteria bacterium CG09_land_8_20_14_0_10_39_12 TaxID=1974885 RepID=A0A2H0WPN6_9BACT|nr:MAG: hypothetical protein COT64_01850 [Candidatus Shapirobacteria bacterium CG09_land_8_20_14_0_10_39_12]
MFRKIALVTVVFALVLGFVPSTAIAASGPVTRWIPVGVRVFNFPNEAAEIVREVEEVEEVKLVFLDSNWCQLVDDAGKPVDEYVQTALLLREELADVRATREQEVLDSTPVGSLTWAQLKALLAGLGWYNLPPNVGIDATPAGTVATTTTVTYTVKAGDTLAAIATQYGISWQDLATANGIVSPYVITVGQVLQIPSGAITTPPATSGTATVGDPTPIYAVKLTAGQSVIPNWGYGPWGSVGMLYPKVQPNGTLPMGPSQPVTDFTGRNWQDHGQWSYVLPTGATEVRVTVQGDAPARVAWTGNKLVLETSAEITVKAPKALDNAPTPSAGSSGISIVIYVK